MRGKGEDKVEGFFLYLVIALIVQYNETRYGVVQNESYKIINVE